MTIITHVCVFTEQPASMIKQFLAERTISFRYTPIDRSYTSLDDVDAVFHIKSEETTGSVGRIIRHWCPDSGVYSNHGAATTRFHSFVYGNLKPEIAITVPLDGTFRLGDFDDRWFFKESNVADRFREYRKDAIIEFDGFLDPEDVSVFPLMFQRLETDFESINVLVPQITKCGFKVFHRFEYRLLPDCFWGRQQPLLIFEKIIIFGGNECVAKVKLIDLVCFVVDGCYTRVISEPCRSRKFIQHQFLGLRGVDFDFPHPHHPF
jgi:hypothetical protein